MIWILTDLFSSRRCILAVKYCVRACVLLTHCSDAFMKQVLPKLFKPVAPFSVGKAGTFRRETFQLIDKNMKSIKHTLAIFISTLTGE